MRFRIFCSVDGGVMGYRESYVKGEDGQVRTFDTHEEAEAEAAECRAAVGKFGPARFTYRVEEA